MSEEEEASWMHHIVLTEVQGGTAAGSREPQRMSLQ